MYHTVRTATMMKHQSGCDTTTVRSPSGTDSQLLHTFATEYRLVQQQHDVANYSAPTVFFVI